MTRSARGDSQDQWALVAVLTVLLAGALMPMPVAGVDKADGEKPTAVAGVWFVLTDIDSVVRGQWGLLEWLSLIGVGSAVAGVGAALGLSHPLRGIALISLAAVLGVGAALLLTSASTAALIEQAPHGVVLALAAIGLGVAGWVAAHIGSRVCWRRPDRAVARRIGLCGGVVILLSHGLAVAHLVVNAGQPWRSLNSLGPAAPVLWLLIAFVVACNVSASVLCLINGVGRTVEPAPARARQAFWLLTVVAPAAAAEAVAVGFAAVPPSDQMGLPKGFYLAALLVVSKVGLLLYGVLLAAAGGVIDLLVGRGNRRRGAGDPAAGVAGTGVATE